MTTPQPTWTTSSFCSVGTCVSVAHSGDTVMVRHSAHPDGITLTFSRDEWKAFLAGVRAGEFDVTTAEGVGGDAGEVAAGLRLTVSAQVRQLGVLDAARRASDALIDSLRSQVAATEARLTSALAAGNGGTSVGYLRDTLALIAENGCKVSSRGTPCNDPSSGRERVSTTGTADQWCDPCRAADALAAAPGEPSPPAGPDAHDRFCDGTCKRRKRGSGWMCPDPHGPARALLSGGEQT